MAAAARPMPPSPKPRPPPLEAPFVCSDRHEADESPLPRRAHFACTRQFKRRSEFASFSRSQSLFRLGDMTLSSPDVAIVLDASEPAESRRGARTVCLTQWLEQGPILFASFSVRMTKR